MKDKAKKEQYYKNPIKDIINFINSIDYINKDITQTKNFNFYQLDNEILDIDINLSPYIEELNNLIKKDQKFIKNEIELYE